VEEILFKHPKIADTTVIGALHPKMGETVRATIVAKERETLTEENVKEHCAKHLIDYKVPRIIEFVIALKKTATGKILKKDYKAIYREIRGD